MEEARRWPRFKAGTRLTVHLLRPNGVLLSAELVDISQKGARISVEEAPEIRPTTPVSLELDRFMLLGEVVWQQGPVVGIELEHLIDLEDVERLRNWD